MKPIIEVKNIGKKYTINHQRGSYVALRDILAGAFRNPFSFLKRNIKGVFETKEPFWALKDISFTVNKGEVVGIIGRNGAGKSTLLKILSRITPPTTGEIKIHGTVGSLLEVGTGFHPELTGRENIFLNGAILGMKKAEIIQKFDEIVAFAGIEKFLDTPVKYYSSGMYVRLAFSVAAHLDPDILIVDEVLAVGDAEFQKKCLGKMEEITQQEGRTILFVSHNMEAIRQLCSKAIILEKGEVVAIGETKEALLAYSAKFQQESTAKFFYESSDTQNLNITDIIYRENKTEFSTGEPIIIDINFNLKKSTRGIFFSMIFFDENNIRCADTMEVDYNNLATQECSPGSYQMSVTVPGIFKSGIYTLLLVAEKGQDTLDKKAAGTIHIKPKDGTVYPQNGRASITLPAQWKKS